MKYITLFIFCGLSLLSCGGDDMVFNTDDVVPYHLELEWVEILELPEFMENGSLWDPHSSGGLPDIILEVKAAISRTDNVGNTLYTSETLNNFSVDSLPYRFIIDPPIRLDSVNIYRPHGFDFFDDDPLGPTPMIFYDVNIASNNTSLNSEYIYESEVFPYRYKVKVVE